MQGIACDRRIDDANTKPRRTRNQGQINLDDFAAGELRRESAMSWIGFCHDQAATGLFVEAMDDPGALDAADVGKPAEMMQQAGNQGPPSMSSPGMHHHTRRLIQHRNNVILKQDLEGHLLGACRFARSDRRFAPDYLVIGAHDVRRLCPRAVDKDATGADHRLDSRARDGR